MTTQELRDLEYWSVRIVADSKSGCWLWTGPLFGNGYARWAREDRFSGRGVHAVVWASIYGEPNDGLEFDHLCRVRRCVNPSHLERVTSKENTLRGVGPTALNKQKTQCPQGHPYDTDNTRWYQGRRYCKACQNIINRKSR